METTKICIKCNATKDISQFTFRKDTQKYRNECKFCEAERKKNHRLDKLDHYNELKKQYYIENKEKLKKQSNFYWFKNKDKINKYRRKWRKENSMLVRNQSHRRRANLKNSDVTPLQIKELVKKSKNCYWCNIKLGLEYHIDHYTPISKGGEHTISNLVVSCPSCNLQKHAKDPYEFALEKGRLL